MSLATDTYDSDLLFICKIVISVDFYHTVSIGHGGVVWAWNLLGCVQPFQCQHPGTHQSLGWTFPRPRPAGCLFHARNGRPRLQSGWVQLQCGSDQSGPPGMFYCRVGASKTDQLQHSVILISEINYVCVQHSCSCVNGNTTHLKKNPASCQTHHIHQQLLAGFSNAPEGHVNILLAWQAIHTVIQWVRHRFGHLKHNTTASQWPAVGHSNDALHNMSPSKAIRAKKKKHLKCKFCPLQCK